MSSRPFSIALIFGLAAALGPVPLFSQGADSSPDFPHELVVVTKGRFTTGSGKQSTEIPDLTAY